MPADVLIYAIVAAGLVFWLRNILGTRHGDERERSNPFTSQSETVNNPADAVVGIQGGMPLISNAEDMAAGLDRNMSLAGEEVERGLLDIAHHDRNFDLLHFLRGAQDAFVLIIESFAEGDKETLKNLLSPDVYQAFKGVIDERAKKGEKANVEIHSIRKTEVTSANVKDKKAYITVTFTADETSIVRDKDDKVIFGDPERVTETIDIWTFMRPIRSREPVWLLCETREHEDDEVKDSTVPETDK